MAKKRRISFWATETIKIPKKVSFKTKEGKTVSFTAKGIIKKPKKVSFYAKEKK